MESFSDISVGEFVRRAASDAPVPGGGGVAALVGALGGAMASMAANFTVGKPKFAEHDQLMRDTLAGLGPILEDLRRAVDDDAAAFSGISEAYRLPRGDAAAKAARKAAVEAALAASMRVPLRVLSRCGEAAALLPALAGAGNPNLLSDVAVAAIMIEAAARAALVNVLVNSRSLESAEARRAEAEGGELVEKIAALAARARAVVEERA